MPEQTAARRIRERHAAEAIPVYARDPVVPRQSLVDERVVGAQEIHHAAILAKLVLDEQFRLTLERRAKVLVELRKQLDVGPHVPDVAQLQPLIHEVVDEHRRTWVGDHPPHLLVQHGRVRQLPTGGHVEKLVIGDAAPQEERQPRRELDVGEAMDGCTRGVDRITLYTEEEIRADEQTHEGDLDAGFEVTLVTPAPVELHERIDVFGRGGAPIRAAGERRENRPRAGFVVIGRRLTREDPAAARRLSGPTGIERTLDGDSVHPRV